MLIALPGGPTKRAPGRLCAIHAIELYINAFLLVRGETPAAIRGLQHDMAARADRLREHGIVLRTKTAAHLRRLSLNREYLVVRYAPDRATELSQLNRLTATLDQVAEAIRKAVGSVESG